MPPLADDDVIFRPARDDDADAIWAILEPTLRAGETYALPRDISRDAAIAYWTSADTFVAECDGQIVGTYYLRPNQLGGGDHVANCGYMVSASAVGRGIARRMCEDSQRRARDRGFLAMQFNFVVATNARAVDLWRRLGFQEVGRLPGAFRHPRLDLVDALVMSKALVGDPVDDDSTTGA